jgi:hypothetical protein
VMSVTLRHEPLCFLALEFLLLLLFAASVALEVPQMRVPTGVNVINGDGDDMRYFTASRLTVGTNILRYAVLLYLPLAVLYVIVPIVHTVRSLAFAVATFGGTVVFIVLLITLFFSRTPRGTSTTIIGAGKPHPTRSGEALKAPATPRQNAPSNSSGNNTAKMSKQKTQSAKAISAELGAFQV